MDDLHFQLSYPVNCVRWDGKQICQLPFEDICRQLDDLLAHGITQVMLSAYHCEEPSNFDPDEETVKVGNALRERGMTGAQHHAWVSTWAPPSEPQDEVLRRLKKCIDYTVNVNSEVMVIHAMKCLGTGDAGSLVEKKLNEEIGKHSQGAILEILQRNLHLAGEYAREKGVLIAVENLDRFTPWCNIEMLPKIVFGAESENVGFCLDTGHAWCAGVNPSDWVPVMGNKLFTTHVHDNHGLPQRLAGVTRLLDPCTDGIDEHLPPGFGTIDWIEFIHTLHDNHYKRVLNFESNGWPTLEKADAYACAIKYWRTSEKLALKKRKS